MIKTLAHLGAVSTMPLKKNYSKPMNTAVQWKEIQSKGKENTLTLAQSFSYVTQMKTKCCVEAPQQNCVRALPLLGLHHLRQWVLLFCQELTGIEL